MQWKIRITMPAFIIVLEKQSAFNKKKYLLAKKELLEISLI